MKSALSNNRVEESLSKTQWMFIMILGLGVSIRQVAMTMVMPFLSVYSQTLTHYSPLLAGIALGIFGLGQAIFQIPFGIWSDHVGNKKVILVGLFLVILGLLMAYVVHNMYLFILARALQGSGAIIAVVFSWVSNDINSDNRIKAMSFLSTSIAVAAALSFIIGPIIHVFISVNDMFLICAIIITLSWMMIFLFLKEKNVKKTNLLDAPFTYIKSLLKSKMFLSLNFISFINNYMMTAVFYVIPMNLVHITGLNGMWKIFMPAVIVALIVMKWIVPLAQKGYSLHLLRISSIICLIGIFCCFYNTFYMLLIGCSLFMISYLCIATLSQNEANHDIDENRRGTANGIFNSFQYLGSFIGSVLTGLIWGIQTEFALILTSIIALFGIVLTFSIHQRQSAS
ncbi:MFS transporter [Niallia sp. 01092]|uniref:MFS transporter n=1 Tax=unclassified Niallia TaxID=2837522 RepID=UPI003FD1CAC0